MKKLMTSTIIVLPLILLAILLVSGAIMSMTSHIYVERLEISETKALVLEMPDEQNPPTYDLMNEVIVLPLQASNRELIFYSDNEDIVKINEEGIITAVSYGSTFVHATSKENKAATDVREIIVTDRSAHIIKFDGDIIAEMYEGEKQQLKAVVLPENADDTTYSFESSDENILQVSDSGMVIATGFGTATITAISNDNNDVKVSVDITSYPKVRSLEIDKTPLTTSETLVKFPNVKINPNNSGINLSYKSSNEDVATVDGQGNITFKKAGNVFISVIATDFGGNSIDEKKEITSTYGYYAGNLFSQQTFTVDYDQYANGEILPIDIISSPEGAFQLINSVTFDIDNVLKFDSETKKFKFVNPMPVGKKFIKVIVLATMFDIQTNQMNEQYEESFILNVTRKATEIKTSYLGEEVSEIRTTQKSFSFSADSTHGINIINILGLPANHTDDWKYEIISGGDIATLDGGNLTFNNDGTVKVRLSLISGEGTHAQTEITVTSVSLKSFEKQVEIKEEETRIVLTLNSETEENGVIFLNTPKGTNLQYSILNDRKIIKLEQDNGICKIVPLKGGFATIQIEAIGVSGNGQRWTVDVYVDKPVFVDNFDIRINGSSELNFRTSLENFKFSVTAFNDNGEMEGKELYIVVDDVETKVDGLTKNGTVNFGEKNMIDVIFAVRYSESVTGKYQITQKSLLSVNRSISTTHGNLDNVPEVLYASNALSAGAENKIVIENVSEKVELKVTEDFLPTDFVLKSHIEIESTTNVKAEVSPDGTTITLTGLNLCKAEEMTLTIGGKTFKLVVDVNLNATGISVSYNGVSTTEINTTQETLTFTTQSQQSSSQINIKLNPEKSTNTIDYQLSQSDIAELVGNRLHFNSAGTAKITIILKSSSGKTTVTEEITVKYTEPKPGEKTIDLTNAKAVHVVLNMTDKSNCDKGIIIFNEPDGATVDYNIESGKEIIQLSQSQEHDGKYIIIPLKGGFGKVKIKASYSNGNQEEWTIDVYVDYKLKENDFSIKINGQDPDGFRTSLESVPYSITVNNENGAMEGKKLQAIINGVQTDITNYDDYTGEAVFTKDETLEITFKAVYSEDSAGYKPSDFGLISVIKTISSTYGKLDDAPIINIKDDKALDFESNNNIVFDDLNKTIILEIEKNFNPSDFDLKTHQPTLNYSTSYLNVSISENGSTITLTSKATCKGDQMYLTVGGKTFTLIVDVYRNAESLSISYNGTPVSNIQTLIKKLNFAPLKDIDVSRINVLVGPEGHTNTISYQLVSGQDCASLNDNELEFTSDGIACVQILVIGYGDKTILKSEISITYTSQSEKRKMVDFSSNLDTIKNIVLTCDSTAEKEEGVIVFNTPFETETEYKVIKGENVVRLIEPKKENENYHIEALCGGEATIHITVTKKAQVGMTSSAEEKKVWNIQVYVDYAVKTSDISVLFNGQNINEFRTSLDSVEYSVSVQDRNGSLAGKDLYVVYNGQRLKADKFTDYTKSISFAEIDEFYIYFEICYQDEIAQTFGKQTDSILRVTKKVSTSRGQLDKTPTIDYNNQPLDQTEKNNIEFSNIGESVDLIIKKSFEPSDFDLKTNKPSISFANLSKNYVDVQISDDGQTITLTSKQKCEGEDMFLSIGGYIFTLNITVIAKANIVKVTYNGEQLQSDKQYKTLLSSLSFGVSAERTDDKDINNKNVEYSLDNSDWQPVNLLNGVFTIEFNDASKIYFRSEDGGASTEIQIHKEEMSDFGVQLETISGTLGTISSVNRQPSAEYDLPSKADYLTIKIPIDSRYLGGFGSNETFKVMFAIELNSAPWEVSYSFADSQILINFKNEKEFNRTIKILYSGIGLQLNLSRIHLERIEFEGFNMNKPETEVYLGQQQVRVFAKKSYYNSQVDYFKIPFSALSSINDNIEASSDNITWKLSRFVGDKVDKVLTIQRGKKVTYDGKQYTIEQGDNGCVLKDQSGKIVTGVTWVDVYSEPEYARIYFGNFAGLSESDIQNDYFGAFDDKPWQPAQVVNKNPNRIFTPSVNAFSFLRVEAGDGTVNGTNTHYNFNVLDDNNIVNVFNAAGYLVEGNRKIVLHNNLYGDGELSGDKLTEAEAAGLILNPTGISGQDDKKMTKDFIYGNGYQVNIKVLNDAVNLGNNAENTGTATHFGMLYNVVLKGTNPHTEITPKNDKLFFVLSGVYYSDIQYYTKINLPIGGTIKNSVLRYVAGAAVQLYNEEGASSAQAYIENVVITECLKGMTFENSKLNNSEQAYYFKGFFDVLNYYNINGFKNAIKNVNNGSLVSSQIDDSLLPDDYGEWFGKSTDYDNYTKANDKYVNIALYSSRAENNVSSKPINYWNGSDYTTDPTNSDVKALKVGLSKVVNVKDIPLIGGWLGDLTGDVAFTGWTYDWKIDVDGGAEVTKEKTEHWLFGNRTVKYTAYEHDMSQLFTDRRDIRLLCQYKTTDVKNNNHIQWHMEKTYRDPSLIKGREMDHVQALIDSLNEDDPNWKNKKWPDGSTPNDALVQAVNINKTLSTFILPKKEEI